MKKLLLSIACLSVLGASFSLDASWRGRRGGFFRGGFFRGSCGGGACGTSCGIRSNCYACPKKDICQEYICDVQCPEPCVKPDEQVVTAKIVMGEGIKMVPVRCQFPYEERCVHTKQCTTEIFPCGDCNTIPDTFLDGTPIQGDGTQEQVIAESVYGKPNAGIYRKKKFRNY